ncbi:hypothetical protein AAVH_06300 [Aphelenchoides avenae]|nr:hypothetical protein AAVH_06300 [Aphelenchus avenae]
MAISAEQLKSIVAELLKAQQAGNVASNEATISSLNSRLPVFRYDPDRDDTFSAYFDRSLVMKRYEFFSMSRPHGSDLIEFSTKLNAACELAKPPLKGDQLKCLRLIQFLEQKEAENKEPTFDEFMAEQQANPVVSYSATSGKGRGNAQKKNHHGSSKSGHGSHAKGLQSAQNKQHTTNASKPSKPCPGCGGSHWRSECKFKNAKCNSCGVTGHIAKVFAATASDQQRRSGSGHATKKGSTDSAKQVNYTKEANTQVHADAPLHCSTPVHVDLQVRGHTLRFLADTGADATLLSLEAYNKLGRSWIDALSLLERLHLLRSPVALNVKAAAYSGTTKEQPISIPSDITSAPQLKEALGKSFPTVFAPSLGHCTKMKAHLHLRKEAQPVFVRKRPVATGMLPIVEQELDRLEKIGAISSVDYSQWAAPIVVVRKKNGKPRVCADFSTGLNDALELKRHPIPTPEDLFNALQGSKFFSTLDLSDAYLQIELDDESKKLCSITTHRGLYRFNRLPFGVKSAPAIFQSVMDQMLAGIPLASVYLDDIIVGGKTLAEHIHALYQVFERIHAYGFNINLEKCKILLRKIHYLGRIVDAEGVRPDPERTQAFRELPVPHDIHTVRSFLGALNYYGRFLPQIRKVRAPLDKLTQKDVKFEWTPDCQIAFEGAKDLVCSDLLLCHYDPNLPIEVAADASNLGIGATISHRFPNGSVKVIEHASRVLTAAERNYGQIEKEGLALIFAVKKFHRMIYGRRFTLLTDHKPLLSIFGSKKGIPAYTASRLQRWALTLLAYDFEIKYIKTTDFGQADVLSRLIAKQQAKTDDEEIVIASFFASEHENEELILDVLATNIDSFPITSDEIMDETATDELLQQVIDFTNNGWPRKCPENRLSAYFNKRDSLSLVHARRRSTDNEVEHLVRSCSQCARSASQPVKHELTPWPETNECWSRIHIDYAGPTEGKMMLVVVDSHSKWLDVGVVPKADTTATIAVLRKLFALHGLCRTIVSDNGTQFTSFQFKQFYRLMDFLMAYRSTPSDVLDGKSPAEIFLGRKMRTRIDLLKPESAPQPIRDEKKVRMSDQFNSHHGARAHHFAPIVPSAGTSTSCDADPRFLFLMPFHRPEVLQPLQSIHHHAQLLTRQTPRHHALLHRLHDERLLNELLRPVHLLHISRSRLLHDAILAATVTPTNLGDSLLSTRELLDATDSP